MTRLLGLTLSLSLVFGCPAEMVVTDAGPDAETLSPACECETQECVDDFIREEFGCGLCIHILCEEGRQASACLLCD